MKHSPQPIYRHVSPGPRPVDRHPQSLYYAAWRCLRSCRLAGPAWRTLALIALLAAAVQPTATLAHGQSAHTAAFVAPASHAYADDAGQNSSAPSLQLPQGGYIATYAGNGTAGYSGDGGAATLASVNQPQDIAVAASGNLYIADQLNSVVREVVTATEVITTIAGGGSGCPTQTDPFGDGCPATQAILNYPSAVALDGNGNLYIADTNDALIREVSKATGIISAVAGDGTIGYSGDGGPATKATLAFPGGIAVGPSNALYIADTGNNSIREVVGGIIQTIAGSQQAGFSGDGGPAKLARFNGPKRVKLDSQGNVYIADTFNQRVREITAATGIINTFAGSGNPSIGTFSGDGGPATQAGLNAPWSIALDNASNLFIADNGNDRIREVIAATGIITTVAGNGSLKCGYNSQCYNGDGIPALRASLANPQGVAVDGGGNFFISDSYNDRIRVVGAAGNPPPAALDGPGYASPLRAIAVSGTHFGPHENVNVYWDSTGAAPLISATTTGNGAFAASLTVPAAISATHTMIAVGQTSGFSATAPLRIRPRIETTRYAGTPGTPIGLSGYGFGAGEGVSAYWNAVGGPLLGSSSTDATGSFSGTSSISFTVPYTRAGSYDVVALGSGGITLTSPLVVLAGLDDAPSYGTVGTTVTVTGSAFAGGEHVTLHLDSTANPAIGTATAGANGSFTAAAVVPASTFANHRIIALGQRSGITAAAPFYVLPAMALSPTSGPVGTRVTVTGSGFGAGNAVTVRWDSAHGLIVASGHADSNGSLAGGSALTFAVPQAGSGTHLVYLDDPRISTNREKGFYVTRG